MKVAEIEPKKSYRGKSGGVRYLTRIRQASGWDYPYTHGSLLACYIKDRGPAAGVREDLCELRSFARWAIEAVE